MNLIKLFETQKVLRDRIGYTEHDRFNKLVLALLVELGECANEWRGFKFWSKNQKPSEKVRTSCKEEDADVWVCGNMQECGEEYESKVNECPSCGWDTVLPWKKRNPLLEEYVDGLHFVLELGIEMRATDPWQPSYEEDITEQFRTLYYHISLINQFTGHDDFEYTVSYYLGLGEMLGFTWEQIEQAYFEKNKVNHQRQDSGY